MRRFHSTEIDLENGVVRLDPDQSAHARSVLRLREGDEVSVFDGAGREFACEIGKLERSGSILVIRGEIDPPAPESALELTLAPALLKNDKFDLVIQKAVELGVKRLIPLISKRTEVQARKGGSRIERWRKIIVEASKQCGRAKLMDIVEPLGLQAVFEESADLRIVFAERDGGALPEAEKPRSIVALVGPEGGWEDEEIRELTEAGFCSVSMGRRILRAETASIAAAAMLQNRFGDLGKS